MARWFAEPVAASSACALRTRLGHTDGHGSLRAGVEGLDCMGIRHAIVTFGLNAGVSVAKRTDGNLVRHLIGRLSPVLTDVPLTRLGADGDGGYLVPEDLADVSACFSP